MAVTLLTPVSCEQVTESRSYLSACSFWVLAVNCAFSSSLVLTLVLGCIVAAFNVNYWAARGSWRLQAKQKQMRLG